MFFLPTPHAPLPATLLACSPWPQFYIVLPLLMRFPPIRSSGISLSQPLVRPPSLEVPLPGIRVSSCVLPSKALRGSDSHLNHSFTPQTRSECLLSPGLRILHGGTEKRRRRRGPPTRGEMGAQGCHVHPRTPSNPVFSFWFIFPGYIEFHSFFKNSHVYSFQGIPVKNRPLVCGANEPLAPSGLSKAERSFQAWSPTARPRSARGSCERLSWPNAANQRQKGTWDFSTARTTKGVRLSGVLF